MPEKKEEKPKSEKKKDGKQKGDKKLKSERGQRNLWLDEAIVEEPDIDWI